MVKKKYLTIPELAKLLGKSRVAVYKDVKSGKIAATRIGRNYVISDRDIGSILGNEMTSKDKKRVSHAVKRVVREYGEVLKRLSKE
jgi:excisionase family DNA binding protein